VSDTPNKIDRRSIINNDIVIKMPPKKANAQRPAWDDSTEAKVDPPLNDWDEKSVKKEDS
jgi:hypothetical protein